MLDSDLAMLYEVETRVLNQAVKRNNDRFPAHYMFQLTADEYKVLMSQFVISKKVGEKRGGRQKLPYVFTEQGVAMLSSVLHSKKAIQINIQIIDTFVQLRQYAIGQKDVSNRLDKLEEYLISYCRDNEADKEEIYQAIDLLMDRTKPTEVGFKT